MPAFNLASGLHTRLADDRELRRLPAGDDRWIWDLRCEPEQTPTSAQATGGRALPCQRVLAVGTDMAVGKMSACLESAENSPAKLR